MPFDYETVEQRLAKLKDLVKDAQGNFDYWEERRHLAELHFSSSPLRTTPVRAR